MSGEGPMNAFDLEHAFRRLCDALGIEASPQAYLKVPEILRAAEARGAARLQLDPASVNAQAEGRTPEDDWRALVGSAHRWANSRMDQWEKVRFQTESGMVYLTLSYHDERPQSFDLVDAEGQGI